MKKEIPLNKSNRLINIGQVILVSSSCKGKNNIITIAWHMPISHKPPILGISIASSHCSHELIQQSQEFIINIPTIGLLDKVVYCGTHSGYEVDKFKETGLNPKKANRLANTPIIDECVGHIECRVIDIKQIGDHSLFIAEPVYASAEEDIFDEVWNINKAKLIMHLGAKFFSTPDKKIAV